MIGALDEDIFGENFKCLYDEELLRELNEEEVRSCILQR